LRLESVTQCLSASRRRRIAGLIFPSLAFDSTLVDLACSSSSGTATTPDAASSTGTSNDAGTRDDGGGSAADSSSGAPDSASVRRARFETTVLSRVTLARRLTEGRLARLPGPPQPRSSGRPSRRRLAVRPTDRHRTRGSRIQPRARASRCPPSLRARELSRSPERSSTRPWATAGRGSGSRFPRDVSTRPKLEACSSQSVEVSEDVTWKFWSSRLKTRAPPRIPAVVRAPLVLEPAVPLSR